MQKERETMNDSHNRQEIMDLLAGLSTTKRESMLIENREDAIIQEIINLKAKAKMLPITMRKLYSYKVVNIDKTRKAEEKKVIPLVLRKRLLLEKAVNG